MPTYEYLCDACEYRFELFQSMKDSPKRTCPDCGKKSLRRLIGTGAALLFKGSGFYQTDYRSESYKKAAHADAKPADPGSTTKPDGSSTKPAPTPVSAASKPSTDSAGGKAVRA